MDTDNIHIPDTYASVTPPPGPRQDFGFPGSPPQPVAGAKRERSIEHDPEEGAETFSTVRRLEDGDVKLAYTGQLADRVRQAYASLERAKSRQTTVNDLLREARKDLSSTQKRLQTRETFPSAQSALFTSQTAFVNSLLATKHSLENSIDTLEDEILTSELENGCEDCLRLQDELDNLLLAQKDGRFRFSLESIALSKEVEELSSAKPADETLLQMRAQLENLQANVNTEEAKLHAQKTNIEELKVMHDKIAREDNELKAEKVRLDEEVTHLKHATNLMSTSKDLRQETEARLSNARRQGEERRKETEMAQSEKAALVNGPLRIEAAAAKQARETADNIEAGIQMLEAERKELSQARLKLQEKINQARETQERVDEKARGDIASLQARLHAVKQMCASKREQMKEAADTVHALETKTKQYMEEIGTTESQIKDVTASTATLRRDLASLEARRDQELGEARKIVQELKEDVRSSEEGLNTIYLDSSQLSDVIYALQSKLDSLKDEVNRAGPSSLPGEVDAVRNEVSALENEYRENQLELLFQEAARSTLESDIDKVKSKLSKRTSEMDVDPQDASDVPLSGANPSTSHSRTRSNEPTTPTRPRDRRVEQNRTPIKASNIVLESPVRRQSDWAKIAKAAMSPLPTRGSRNRRRRDEDSDEDEDHSRSRRKRTSQGRPMRATGSRKATVHVETDEDEDEDDEEQNRNMDVDVEDEEEDEEDEDEEEEDEDDGLEDGDDEDEEEDDVGRTQRKAHLATVRAIVCKYTGIKKERFVPDMNWIDPMSVQAFKDGKHQGPVLKKNGLLLDLPGGLTSPWNKAAITLLAHQARLASYKPNRREPEKGQGYFEKTVRERLRHFFDAWKFYRPQLKPNSVEYETEKEAQARWTTKYKCKKDFARKNGRKNRKFEHRLAAIMAMLTQHRENGDNQALELWEKLGSLIMKLTKDGMSSDESSSENGIFVYRVRLVAWRREMNKELMLVDKVYTDHPELFQGAGARPVPRLRSSTTVSFSAPVPRLPKTLYDKRWMKGLSEYKLMELGPTEEKFKLPIVRENFSSRKLSQKPNPRSSFRVATFGLEHGLRGSSRHVRLTTLDIEDLSIRKTSLPGRHLSFCSRRHSGAVLFLASSLLDDPALSARGTFTILKDSVLASGPPRKSNPRSSFRIVDWGPWASLDDLTVSEAPSCVIAHAKA
ncbi:uncharacterized protein STEHIDRAFT_163324 [Stereum hirsutum FP-91666 SS1]|uniref:Uncharacterized protein n=1 Tax=Stereum hirsutum (strain FP-91666) TaxID=721885 RepID=R7RXZ2_STEHR|nr:uncharacterized protein STEHIDRAFT_163324 [Stereum hirsutum FP-91666 SS1]EIM79765.1 hypothetical protein STEHIDRAFT_163324 [Stereum hirsutum FP-91666 SS1]